jgi:hypothetical protein
MIFINLEILSAEVAEATGLISIAVSETPASAANPNTILLSWFINFFKESKAMLST